MLHSNHLLLKGKTTAPKPSVSFSVWMQTLTLTLLQKLRSSILDFCLFLQGSRHWVVLNLEGITAESDETLLF